jgi:hypothetical protein
MMMQCPVCEGGLRRPAAGEPYAHLLSGYDAVTDTLPCNNCGAQYGWGFRPTGQVRVNGRGQACTHLYRESQLGRAWYLYRCEHCGDSFKVDSGD